METKFGELNVAVYRHNEVDWPDAEGPKMSKQYGSGKWVAHVTHVGAHFIFEPGGEWSLDKVRVTGRRILKGGELSDSTVELWSAYGWSLRDAPKWLRDLVDELRPTTIVSVTEQAAGVIQ